MAQFSFHRQSLAQWFSPATVDRGLAYHAAGRVIDVAVRPSGHGHVVTGLVRGQTAIPYRVEVGIWPTGGRWRIDSECTCPVGRVCKHAVAVLASISGDQRAVTPKWERDLGAALSDLETLRAGPADATDLALSVDLSVNRRWGEASPFSLSIRPVRRGRNGGWVKTGASWSELRYSAAYGGSFDPVQIAALSAMSAAFLQTYSNQNPQLLALNDLLWPLLRRCVEVGIELVAGNSLSTVEVIGPQTVSSDVRRVGDVIELRTGVQVDGQWWPEPGHELAFIGRPAHGVALLRRTGAGAKPSFDLVLAPLTRPVEATTQRLVAQPVQVPAEHRSTFELDYLPRLRRQLDVMSLDSSVDLPEPPRPRLELTLTWHDTHRADTSWAWRYGERRYALGAGDGLRQVRDVAAEASLLEDLHLDVPSLLDVGGDLLPVRSWTGRDLIELATAVLPDLRQQHQEGSIELREVGHRRDYRPAESDPEIRFEVVEGDDAPTDWLDLSIIITVDGEAVPLGVALAALTRRDELVFTETGRHVPATHPAFEQLAELVVAAKHLVDQPTEGLRVARHDVAMWNELEALGVVDAQAEQWMRSARALREFETLPVTTSSALAARDQALTRADHRDPAVRAQPRRMVVAVDQAGLGSAGHHPLRRDIPELELLDDAAPDGFARDHATEHLAGCSDTTPVTLGQGLDVLEELHPMREQAGIHGRLVVKRPLEAGVTNVDGKKTHAAMIIR